MRTGISGLIGASLIIALPPPAAAYRPFDGTDAAVADVGEVELELEPGGVLHTGSQSTMAGPYGIYNYGFAERWEVVLQATAQAPPEEIGPTSVPNAALLKYVVLPGVLQDKPGASVATEFGMLLPEGDASGVGLSWSGIVSQRWDWGTVHLNLEANLTPDQHGEILLDAIIEGPRKWAIRPVAEVYFDNVFNQSQTVSALIGAIWQARDNVAFDVGVRYALVNGRPVSELRAGVTVGFQIIPARPTSAEQANALSLDRR